MQDARKWKNHFRLTIALIQIELSSLIISMLRLVMYTSYKAQRI
jgi:hypothetical protein